MKTTLLTSTIFGSAAIAAPLGSSPILLAAKVGDHSLHLYGEAIDDKNFVLGYGDPSRAQAFNLDGEIAHAGPISHPLFVGELNGGWLGYSSAVGFHTSLDFDKNKKVINKKFYACSGLANEGKSRKGKSGKKDKHGKKGDSATEDEATTEDEAATEEEAATEDDSQEDVGTDEKDGFVYIFTRISFQQGEGCVPVDIYKVPLLL